jgi:hypothetical protein
LSGFGVIDDNRPSGRTGSNTHVQGSSTTPKGGLKNPLESQLSEVHLIWLILVVVFVLLAIGAAAVSSISDGPRR